MISLDIVNSLETTARRMNWFYAKDGQQIGPVEFSEIERLHSEGAAH